MSKIRAIIVDDEKHARAGVSVLLSKDTEFELLDTCANGSQAIESITHYNPDVVFLDIQMPDMNGFDVLNSLPGSINPLVVFITAFDQYAIKAFEASAFDYLLKPFDDERFYEVLERSKKQISLMRSGEYSQSIEELVKQFSTTQEKTDEPGGAYFKRIMVKRAGGVTFINVEDIIAIEALDYHLKLITTIDEHLMRKSLNNIEEKLDPAQFVRIHRSTIININFIKNIEKYTADEHVAILTNGSRYRISKSGRKILKDKFLG